MAYGDGGNHDGDYRHCALDVAGADGDGGADADDIDDTYTCRDDEFNCFRTACYGGRLAGRAWDANITGTRFKENRWVPWEPACLCQGQAPLPIAFLNIAIASKHIASPNGLAHVPTDYSAKRVTTINVSYRKYRS